MFLLLPFILLTIMLSFLMYRFSEESMVIIIYFSYYILAVIILSSIWYKSIHFLCKTADIVKNNVRVSFYHFQMAKNFFFGFLVYCESYHILQKIMLHGSDLSVTDFEPLWVNLSRLAKATGWDFSFTLRY